MCMHVCLSTGDMADRPTNRVCENIQRHDCELLSLGTAFLFCKNRMGALGPKIIKLLVSSDSKLKLSHQCGEVSEKPAVGLHQWKGSVLSQRGESPESSLAGVESQTLCSEKGGQDTEENTWDPDRC